MSKNKNSFIIYTDSLDVLDKLTNNDIAALFHAIRDYHNGKELNLSPLVEIAFSSFEGAFKRDRKKYEAKCAVLAKNASKGGKKTIENKRLAANASKSEQIKRDSDSDSDSDSDLKDPYQEEELVINTFTGEIVNFPDAKKAGEF